MVSGFEKRERDHPPTTFPLRVPTNPVWEFGIQPEIEKSILEIRKEAGESVSETHWTGKCLLCLRGWGLVSIEVWVSASGWIKSKPTSQLQYLCKSKSWVLCLPYFIVYLLYCTAFIVSLNLGTLPMETSLFWNLRCMECGREKKSGLFFLGVVSGWYPHCWSFTYLCVVISWASIFQENNVQGMQRGPKRAP